MQLSGNMCKYDFIYGIRKIRHIEVKNLFGLIIISIIDILYSLHCIISDSLVAQFIGATLAQYILNV